MCLPRADTQVRPYMTGTGAKTVRRKQIVSIALLFLVLAAASPALARQREPNGAYTERRAKLLAQVDGPVVLFGYTGKENDSPSYVFNQEENFYYLTGHNEAGAALLLVPAAPNGKGEGAREILFLPPRDRLRERWDGPRIGPADADVKERTGFVEVKAFSDLRAELERTGKMFPRVYTLLPRDSDAGYPHARTWQYWLYQILPQSSFRDAAPLVGAMRQIKSATELALLERAVELSMDAHLEAMKMMRPGIYEYEVAARMEYVHKRGGCEGEAYAPIVGSGFFSTVLHYNAVDKKIEDGDVIVLDVGGQYSGYAADITRTLPASGKFTARQREIYEIVLGAQQAALAALKPGMSLGRSGPNSLHKIAYDYINAHGKDRDGKPLGRYFIHGLGHHVGLNVHDAGDPNRVLEPGMVVTIEPGIYIPEENLGVRIEDMVLITADGYKLLTARLPRDPGEVEKVMAAGKRQ
jgi:Xaa-Pro aminopeptidase